jgi:valyl-tRNA synthetase
MAYAASEVEEKWISFWFDHKLFAVSSDPDRPSFSIALPPPNVTGNLHLGHALNGTLQDILIRWKRMQGYNVLWQPGTDHASISTHMVVERELRKEGKTRHQIGREAFEKRVWEWCRKYGSAILHQYRRLGVSFAWERTAFTMDDHYVRAVIRAFVTLYKAGHIYRGNRVTNWCPGCLTSVSDLEVEHVETEGYLYYAKYVLDDGGVQSGGADFIPVATTRPETMFGDVAVAVHPDDKRYRHLIGKSVRVPANGRAIPVIADSYVDMGFGSGALKITSAHDVNDWEVCQRHKLPLVAVIDEHGKIIANEYVPSQYQGKDRFDARAQLMEELQEKDLIIEIQPYTHGVAHCERCHTVIEYLPSDQWFVRMKELAQPAITVVEQGRVVFVPERYTATYLDWMQNIRDWCISRQLWFGQRIPIWSCKKCGLVDAFETAPDGTGVSDTGAPSSCTKCGATGGDWEQDPDVLDTWFSSALWPFATLGWPDSTPELKMFYPTNVLSTAREIINLWVARMIFMSMEFCKTIPFKHVLIHPVIQTADGKRMSKSKGNAIDPIDMIDKYGADANRFWYVSLGIKGDQDVRFRPDKLDEYKRFVNKLWNAGRFVLDNLVAKGDVQGLHVSSIPVQSLTLPDRWILHQFNQLLNLVNSALRNYDFDDMSRLIYEFVWNHFCDWYLEIAKQQLVKDSTKLQTKLILQYIFESLLRLMHPIMPFVTEELWQMMPHGAEVAGVGSTAAAVKSIMFAPYPVGDPSHEDKDAATDMELLIRTIKAIRNIRQTYNVDTKAHVNAMVACKSEQEMACLVENKEYISQLCRIAELTIAPEVSVPPLTASEPVFSSTIYLPLSSLIDAQKSRSKLEQRKQSVHKEAARISEVLESGEFKLKAPQDRVQSMEAQLGQLKRQLESIDSQLKVLERT